MTKVKFRIPPCPCLAAALWACCLLMAPATVCACEPETFTNMAGMTFVRIPSGTFRMGSPVGEPGRHNTEHLHEVRITRAFFIQTTEVTQGQWLHVMAHNPSGHQGADLPVEQVSWQDARRFIRKLNSTDEMYQYRLPTEAEWEYAARGGRQTAYYFGDDPGMLDQYAWYRKNSGGRTHPAAQKEPNSFGLFDMHGNVWEWVGDFYDDYPVTPVTDPGGPAGGRIYVRRGGGWMSTRFSCRAAARSGNPPDYKVFSVGLRLTARPVSSWSACRAKSRRPFPDTTP